MWIEVFKTGKHTDSKGVIKQYDHDKLNKIVSLYNEAILDNQSNVAPLVKGHPKTNSPAFGWVERLAKRGNILLAKLKDLAPEISDEIRQGKFKKVSISLYSDDSLRHIGLLGAASPAVKGLKNVEFADCESFAYDYTTEDICLNNNYSELIDENIILKSQLTDKVAETEGLKKSAYQKEINSFIDNKFDGKDYKFSKNSKDSLVNIFDMIYNINECSFNNTGEVKRLQSYSEDLLKGLKQFITELDYINFVELSKPLDDNTEYFGKHIDQSRMAIHKKALDISNNAEEISYEDAINFILNK